MNMHGTNYWNLSASELNIPYLNKA